MHLMLKPALRRAWRGRNTVQFGVTAGARGHAGADGYRHRKFSGTARRHARTSSVARGGQSPGPVGPARGHSGVTPHGSRSAGRSGHAAARRPTPYGFAPRPSSGSALTRRPSPSSIRRPAAGCADSRPGARCGSRCAVRAGSARRSPLCCPVRGGPRRGPRRGPHGALGRGTGRAPGVVRRGTPGHRGPAAGAQIGGRRAAPAPGGDEQGSGMRRARPVPDRGGAPGRPLRLRPRSGCRRTVDRLGHTASLRRCHRGHRSGRSPGAARRHGLRGLPGPEPCGGRPAVAPDARPVEVRAAHLRAGV